MTVLVWEALPWTPAGHDIPEESAVDICVVPVEPGDVLALDGARRIAAPAAGWFRLRWDRATERRGAVWHQMATTPRVRVRAP